MRKNELKNINIIFKDCLFLIVVLKKVNFKTLFFKNKSIKKNKHKNQ